MTETTHSFAPLNNKSPGTIIAEKGRIMNVFDKSSHITTKHYGDKRKIQ
jgi:hypothetical protein